MRGNPLAVVALLAALASACRDDAREVTIAVSLPAGMTRAPLEAWVGPRGAVRSARLWEDGTVMTSVEASALPLKLRMPGFCPVDVSPQDAARAAQVRVDAKPLLDVGGDRAQVGYDAPFAINVAAACRQAASGEIVWRQIEGPNLANLIVEERGFRVSGRTLSFSTLHPDPLPWGIAPIAPSTQGRYVLEATWKGDGPAISRTITLTSIARATGVPSIAVGQRVLLGGAGWHLRAAPTGGLAQVEAPDGLPSLQPDAPGVWRLEDAAGLALSIRVGRHDQVPLDCGRSDCHAAQAEAATRSPMTHALESFLARPEAARSGVSCMLGCHAMGEPGLHDGSLTDVAESLRWRIDGSSWPELPRALRRVGGVTCSACHGPAAIPEPGARWAILRADVCATCHDAPPRYVHVQQWRRSRMAVADASPATRASVECARCHTTAGFLAALGVRKQDALDANSLGIACAACHAAHGATVGESLVRPVSVPAALRPAAPSIDGTASAVCFGCHASRTDDTAAPSASAGELWAGRASIAGDSFAGPAPHAGVRDACLGCHGGERPTDHSFRVDFAHCTGCHSGDIQAISAESNRRLRERAADLSSKLDAALAPASPQRSSDRPPHATQQSRRTSNGRFARALYEIALVVEDPAAGAHNALFARQLLDDAQQTLTALTPSASSRR